MQRLARIGLFSSIFLVALAGRAEPRSDAAIDTSGFFEGWFRAMADVHRIDGFTPSRDGRAPPHRFARGGMGVRIDAFGFLARTRYDTLLGFDAALDFGARRTEDLAPTTKGYVRFESAFDYGLLHWTGASPGRVSFGGGGGFEYDAGSACFHDGRFYPLLLARLQLWPSRDLAMHLAVRYVPVAYTSSEWGSSEWRGELALAKDRIHTAFHFGVTRVSKDLDTLYTHEVGVSMGYAF